VHILSVDVEPSFCGQGQSESHSADALEHFPTPARPRKILPLDIYMSTQNRAGTNEPLYATRSLAVQVPGVAVPLPVLRA
jgi:hypothetical protein